MNAVNGEADFDRYAHNKLPPIWRQTPHALRVDVTREADADDLAYRVPLVLQISYPDRKSLAEALAPRFARSSDRRLAPYTNSSRAA